MADAKAFISYRRSDSQAATGRLFDRLNAAYPGRFFRDISGIGLGVDFMKELERAVGSSVALVAVIGPGWASAEEAGQKRLMDPEDVVRLEIGAALKRGIRILPVLVGGASMPKEEELPEDLRPLRRWNAVQLVEEYYEQGVVRLIDALRQDLGEPVSPGDANRNDTERRVRELRGEAEAALAVEDWFAGVQALQSAVSLDAGNRELGARLRWAHEQRKVSGLFAEGQELYEQGKKSAALGKFRQVKVAAGNFKQVDELIAQLDREVAGETRRSSVRRWTAGALTAVVGAILVVGGAAVWVIQSEFASAKDDPNLAALFSPTAPSAPSPTPVNSPAPGAALQPAASPTPVEEIEPEPAPPVGRAAGVGFPGIGRWRMTSRANSSVVMLVDLQPGGTFQVTMPAGAMTFPLSGGRFEYDASSGMLQVMGVNTMGNMFREAIHVFERENDHFHVTYSNAIWEMTPEG